MTNLRIPLTLSLLLACAPGWAQTHTKEMGPYTVRSSTVSSETISAETARAHGITPSPTLALLNVTVLKNGQTVPAQVAAETRTMTGQARTIPMTATTSDKYVSYTGAYPFSPGETLEFMISARPQEAKETLTLNYRDRMWGGGALPQR